MTGDSADAEEGKQITADENEVEQVNNETNTAKKYPPPQNVCIWLLFCFRGVFRIQCRGGWFWFEDILLPPLFFSISVVLYLSLLRISNPPLNTPLPSSKFFTSMVESPSSSFLVLVSCSMMQSYRNIFL